MTIAHLVVVVPLRHTPLATSALVAGTLAPDVPHYLPFPVSAEHTHSAAGLAVDVLTGLVLYAGYHLVRRSPAALAPRRLPLALVSLLVACAVHVFWDSFTHEGRWGVDHVGALREEYAGHLGYTWAQHVSSASGGLVLLVWLLLRWRRRTRLRGIRRTA